MPEIAPWIRAAEPAQYYGQGYGLGLRQWEQQAQDARQWQAMAQQAQEQAQEQALQAQAQAQRQAVAEQEMQLRAQAMALEQQVQQQKAEESSQMFAARQQYQQRVGAGEDPMAVLMELGPMMGSQQTAEAAAIRAQQQAGQEGFTPSEFTTPGGTRLVQIGRNQWQIPQPTLEERAKIKAGEPPTIANQLTRENLVRQYQQEISTMIREMPQLTAEEPPKKWDEDTKAVWQAGKDRIDEIRKIIQSLPGGPTVSATAGAKKWVYNPRTKKLDLIGAAAQ